MERCDDKVKYCPTCAKHPEWFEGMYYTIPGYYDYLYDTVKTCSKCGTTFEEINMTVDDYGDIVSVAADEKLVKAMIALHEKDEIAYELKMAEFRQKAQQQSQPNVPKCPTCGSTNLSKLSTTGKVAKVGLFGIFGAGDLGKTWKCNNCGSKF